MNRKTLVILLAGVLLLTAIVIVSCAQPTPEVKTVKETVVVKETVTVKETVVVKETVPPPTAAPQPTPTPRPLPPTARLEIEGTGLTNVPVNTPVKLMAVGLDPKVPVTRTTWTLTAPPGSQAKLKDPAAPKTEFTPDVVGTYKVDVVLANAAGAGPMESVKIHVGTLVGENEKNCKTCHPAQVTNYGQTAHAKANIQCEQCHGPASQHLKGEKVMASSHGDGVCDVCHNTPTRLTGATLKNAKHYTGSSFEEITGPARQACARCHSGLGYISFLKNPTNIAAWDNQVSHIGCSVCHDPHAKNNFAQLRIVGKPVELPFEAKDVGLSATCFECHNARTKPADAIKSTFPHYASNAEFLSDTGGVTYGVTVPNSPHGMLIGTAPVPDPADKTKMLFGGQVPGACVVCHMWPIIKDQDPNAKYRMEVGGHSFNVKSLDGKFEYTAPCKSCHGDIKDFNLKAKADYDGNGKVEGVKEEIKGLLNVLWKALEAKGVKKVETGYPYATLPRDAQGNVDDKIDNAFYNFRTVYGVMWGVGPDGKPTPGNEGAAQAMHNFKRSCALLQLSLKDLGALPSAAADCTK